MPPKARFTREEIIDAAIKIVREKGVSSLTARTLAETLGSSAQPIFTVFKNMEEVQAEVQKAAMKIFEERMNKSLEYTPAFKQFGMEMIKFSKEEPKLLQMIFLKEKEISETFEQHTKQLGIMSEVCLDLLEKEYELTKEEAKILFKQSWIYTFGVAVLCATNICCFEQEELEEMLGHSFISMLMFVKAGKLKDSIIHTEKKDEISHT